MQDQLSRFLIAVPLPNKRAETVAQALLDHLIFPYFIPEQLVCDLESSFQSQLLKSLQQSLGIQAHAVKVGGHSSNVSERGIQSLSKLLHAMLEYRYSEWPTLIVSAAKIYNLTPLVELEYSPSYIVFLREETLFQSFNSKPLALVAANYSEYVQLLRARLQTVRNGLIKLNNANKIKGVQEHLARRSRIQSFEVGDLVLLFAPAYSGLQASLKVSIQLIGPLVVLRKHDANSFQLGTIDNQILRGVYHVARLKHVTLRGQHGNPLRTIDDVRQNYNDTLLTRSSDAQGQLCAVAEIDQDLLQLHDNELCIQSLPDCDILQSHLCDQQMQITGYSVSTEMEAHISKLRFKNGQLQAVIHGCSPFTGHWLNFAQEFLLAPILTQLPKLKLKVTGSLEKWKRQNCAFTYDCKF
jgi:hypothetical protein